jgi:hypothetical protein
VIKDESHYWLFVDSKTRVVSRRLSQKGAEEFIKNLRNVNMDNWWAWNPCFRDWIPLKNIVDLREGRIRMLIQLTESGTVNTEIGDGPTEKSEHTNLPKEYSEVRDFLREEPADEIRDFHGDDITFSRVPKPPSLGFGADRRKAIRVEKKVEVLIASRGKSFRTHTVNISLTGVMLDKALPFELQGGPFEIVFILQDRGLKRQLVFQGKVVGDLKDRRRLVFGDLSTSSQQLLEEIFAA